MSGAIFEVLATAYKRAASEYFLSDNPVHRLTGRILLEENAEKLRKFCGATTEDLARLFDEACERKGVAA